MTEEILIKGDGSEPDDYVKVTFTGDCCWENDGIGSYEYWGYKGYDHGNDYIVCDNVEWDEKLYPPEVNAIITQYLANKDNAERIFKALEKEYGDECDARREEYEISKYEERGER